MKTKSKISLVLFFIMTGMFIAMIINITINLRDYGIKGVNNKAYAVATVIKHGLTAHMINGAMDNRELFLDQIQNIKGISKIWLVRSQNVIDQYGNGFNNELARDEIDKEVLSTGLEKREIKENAFGQSSYRITIPYKATDDVNLNCLSCHNAKVGDTLGAISMVIDMDDLKGAGVEAVSFVAVTGFILIFFVLGFVNYVISPYLNIFDSIKHVMQKAQGGDYSKRLEKTRGKESIEVSNWINTLLEKLQTTLTDIETKINIFLTHQKVQDEDPLIDVKNTVTRLSEIYKFRKTIEHDENIHKVYDRFAHILRTKFNLDNFIFIEADTTRKETKIVYAEKEVFCDAEEKGCRADRTNTMVDSCQFHNLCDRFKYDDKHYICMPYSISNDLDFIIGITTQTKDEAKEVRRILPEIQDYIDAAKPEIVSKKLMEILERSARTDALTGLYNRKFLEESVEKIVYQAQRSNISYGILMADIDYFKMINDTYGHDIGDEAIKVIAKTLEEETRSSDFVIRFGGEEFIVLLYNCDAEYVKNVAEKIRESFSQKKIQAGTEQFTKTISIGASIFPDHEAQNFWKCIKYADLALYKAKHSGRNQVVLFDESLLENENLKDEY